MLFFEDNGVVDQTTENVIWSTLRNEAHPRVIMAFRALQYVHYQDRGYCGSQWSLNILIALMREWDKGHLEKSKKPNTLDRDEP